VTSQSAANHAHHPVPTYIATVLWLAAMVCIGGSLWLGWSLHELGVFLLGLTVFPVVGVGRWYTVKLQDRIIQLEMQVRCARVVALRFASDDELSDLLQRAVKEQMTPAAIKGAIRQWRPDYMRT
jgi:hypothetical protein